MSIFMFSLAGIPPAAGFLGKLYIFEAAIHANLTGFAILGLLASVVGVYYYLMVVARMWMEPEENAIPQLSWSAGTTVSLVVCAAMTLILFIAPSGVVNVFSTATDVLAPMRPALPPCRQSRRDHRRMRCRLYTKYGSSGCRSLIVD